MTLRIDYYVTSASPWVYLGHRAARDVASRQGATLNVKPVSLMEMFKASGQVPLAQRAEVRQRYRLIELQRFAEFRGRTLNLRPKFGAADPSLADRSIIALIAGGGDPLDYMDMVFAARWADELDIADEATLAALLGKAGHDARDVLGRAATPDVEAIRLANTQDAIAVDAVGVPCFVLNGEPFWGQDRLELLERALSAGRPPYSGHL